MELTNSPRAVSTLRAFFRLKNKPMTLRELYETGLQANQISMALCYLKRQRYLTLVQVDNPEKMGRKKVYLYTYHDTKLQKENV